MGVRINNNIEAFNAQRNLSTNATSFAKSIEKLSSGLRINRAGDDAAGLAVSEKLRAQVRGLNQASRNAQDGISMIQTAEGALNEVQSMVQRMRELAVQASNDTLSTSDRTSINLEMTQLKGEINSISTRTKFNGQSLLTGGLVTSQASGTLVQGLTMATGSTAIVTNVDVANAAAGTTFTVSISGADITLTRASDSVAQTVTASNLAANAEGTLDFSQLGIKITVQASAGGKTGANLATDLNTTTIVTSATGSANFQIGSQASDFMNVAFSKVALDGSATSGLDALTAALSTFNGTQNVANSQGIITAADSAIDDINSARATLGAYQNRLEHTIANLGVATENLSASESRIRDTDMAAEMVNFTRSQILQQAGTAILAQANQAPQSVLQLLR